MDAGPRIAIDAMGGDTGPAAIVAGIARARRKDSSLQFILFGDEKIVREELKKHDRLEPGVTVHHAPESIASTEKPSQAIRRAKTHRWMWCSWRNDFRMCRSSAAIPAETGSLGCG